MMTRIVGPGPSMGSVRTTLVQHWSSARKAAMLAQLEIIVSGSYCVSTYDTMYV